MSDVSKDIDQSPAEHVAAAHKLLKSIEDELAAHPVLAEAILKLENALSLLTLQTKGLL
jgi:hypothetical protein